MSKSQKNKKGGRFDERGYVHENVFIRNGFQRVFFHHEKPCFFVQMRILKHRAVEINLITDDKVMKDVQIHYEQYVDVKIAKK
jgi:hypothetical protein